MINARESSESAKGRLGKGKGSELNVISEQSPGKESVVES